MSLIPQFKTELQYIPTVKACLKLSGVDCSKEITGLTADCQRGRQVRTFSVKCELQKIRVENWND